MARLRVNILANYAGHIWMALMGVAFLPLYIRILGMEAFGLVGLMLSFQSILQLFDFGIGGAVNRELSRRAHDPASIDGARDLVRTSEWVIWSTALAASLLLWVSSGWMADHWLNLRSMERDEARRAIGVMGIAVAWLWPSTFYANCLSGLERQPTLNFISTGFVTLRYAGVLPVLLWVSPSIEAFLWWHVLVGAAQSLTTALAVWQALPPGRSHAHWSPAELRGSQHFAGGLFAVGVLALCVTQLDRLILTSLRPLEELGYYTLALSVAAGLGRMVQPMFNALYPRFSRLVADQDYGGIRHLYHLSSQYLAVVIAAISMVLIIFAQDVLYLWTADADLARKAALPLAILVAGSALNGLMNIPYALQLANGWTKLALMLNTVSLLIGLPLCFWAVRHYEMTGASLLWLLVNLISFAVGIPIMHRKLLLGRMRSWYLRDNLPSFVAAFCVAWPLGIILHPLPRTLAGILTLCFVCLVVFLASALASREVRMALRRYIFAGKM